ncbi:hypothetical protein BPAE_0042g00440 [Botrytis paeoniae]|uniref:Uncharacterized protein n=1 Tax=Botrytis paeoniae TaxID=278948 RepID=A0A4Z1G096_9HELO|nr:hypothetical protein BPAE_0042g00440 [Botrytis paeoniae]
MASSSAAGAPNTSNLQQLKDYAITFSGPSISSLLANQREQELPSDDRTICALVVGLYLSNTGAFDITKAPIIETDKGNNKGMPVGKDIPISPGEFDYSPVFRVVVKVVEEILEEGAKLHVLLEEKDGLSVPYRVAQNKVFFSDEFRDDSPSRAKREVSWMANVKKHSVMEGRVSDTSKLACGPKEGLRNSLAKHLVLLRTLEGPPPEDLLRSISNTLRSAYTDMYQRDMPSSETIDAFVDRDSAWDQTCTSNFISAIKRDNEAWVRILKEGLKSLVQGTADWNKAAIDNLGDNVMKVDSWTAIFEGYSSARDRDAQKILSASLARSMFSQITIKHDGTIKILEEMIRLTEMWLNRASQ